MQSTPRSPSIRGLSTLGTLLLAVAGLGVAALLYSSLSSVSESRAAGDRSLPDEPSGPAPTEPAAAELVPGTDEAPDEPASKTTVVESVATTTLAPQAVVAEESQKIAGPPLKHIKGGGKSTMGQEEIHAAQRERRREKVAASEQGIAPVESAELQNAKKPAAATNPNRSRLTNHGAGGGPARTKGKKK